MNDDIKIVVVREEDRSVVFEYMKKEFYKYEPLGMSCEETVIYDMDEMGDLCDLHEELCFVAMKSDQDVITVDNIIGLVQNEILTRDSIPLLEELIQTTTQNTIRKIYTVIRKVQMEADLFKDSSITEYLITSVLSTNSKYRHMGIAQRLLEYSLDVARKKGFKHAYIECSSMYSTLIARKLGYKEIHRLSLEDYKDENGEIIFKTKHPHTHFISLLREL